MNEMEITSLSSRGQVVIPSDIRKKMGLSNGTKLMVFYDGEQIFMKPVVKPEMKEIRKMSSESRKFAKEIGLTKADVSKALKKVRNANRS